MRGKPCHRPMAVYEKPSSGTGNRNRQGKLTALLHHVNINVLRASFFGLKKTAAPGVDEMTWTEYAKHLEANLRELHVRVHTGRIERCRHAGSTYRRRMADSGRSASLQ